MTEKLYYLDSHLYDFTAVITDILSFGDRKAVVLNRTAFFPEGGGQPGDEGYVGSMKITDTQEQNGEVLHFVDGDISFSRGDEVNCSVNAGLRFSRMQAHSGEHILSGVAHKIYGAENVGFHMADLVMTVDFDKPLSKEQLAGIEKEANEWVYKNVPVTAEFVSPEKLNTLQYRSKLDLKENVRIVTIEGCDMCACCAPHVARTGEIGIIKILTAVSHRGGVRITVVCGAKAYGDYCRKHADIMVLSDMLKAPNDAVPAALEELSEKLTEEKRNSNLYRQRLYDYIARGLEKTADCLLVFVDDFSPDELRELAEKCKTKSDKLFAVFSGDDEHGYAFAVSSQNVKLRSLSAKLNGELNARGGGRDEMLQGKAGVPAEKIKKFFSEIEV